MRQVVMLLGAGLLFAWGAAHSRADTEAGMERSEQIRQRLVHAHRLASGVHSALLWKVVDRGVATTYVTEVYRSGDLAGMRLYRREGERESTRTLTLTNGEYYWGEVGGQPIRTEGHAAIESHLVPYGKACRFLAQLWGVSEPGERSWAASFTMNRGAGGGDFYFGVRITPDGVPSWLEREFTAGREFTPAPTDGLVLLRGPGLEVAVREADAMPVSWSYASDELEVTAETTSVVWTAAAWERQIADHLGHGTTNEQWNPTCRLASRGLGSAISWFIETLSSGAVPYDRLLLFATTLAGVDFHACGDRSATVAQHSGQGSHDDDRAIPATDMDALAQELEDRIEEVVRACAAEQNWHPSEEDLARVILVLQKSYRTSLYALQLDRARR